MAHLQRQGSQWTIRFTYEGKRRRITVGSDKKSAHNILRKLEGRLIELNLGFNSLQDRSLSDYLLGIQPEEVTLGDAILKYQRNCKVAISTLRIYQIHFSYFTSFFGNNANLKTIEVESYVNHRRKKVSDTTIKKELISLANLNRCYGFEDSNFPSLYINRKRAFSKLERTSDGRSVLLSKEEVDELRSTVRQRGSTLIADAVDLIAFTGIRRSELCRLTPDDVDLDSQTLLITEKKRVHGQTTYRKLPIHPALLSLIKNRMSNDPLFTKSVHTLTSGLRKAIKGTKFQKRGFGFHVLRHSAASRLLAQGIPVTAVAAILGHATPQTTLQVYSHAFEEDVAEGINSL